MQVGFKNALITEMDPWAITEASDAMPTMAYPHFVGSGLLGVGLDASGLQSLPDCLGPYYQPPFAPFHYNQGDLYVLHEGMISSHLWRDEELATGIKATDRPEAGPQVLRNYMPLGQLRHAIEFGGVAYAGADLRRAASFWHRRWSLRQATVSTGFALGADRNPVASVRLDVFAPYGGQSVYLCLRRTAASIDAPMTWTVSLPLLTRAGLALFDQPDEHVVGRRTLLARIGRDSAYAPAEPYAVVYGVACAGGEVAVGKDGWTVTFTGSLAEAQTTWLRMDFVRLAGQSLRHADRRRHELEAQLERFTLDDALQAHAGHVADWEAFWTDAADVVVDADADAPEQVRRSWLMHLSQYLLRCGNEPSMGGNVQGLLAHQNGWKASSFHDHHYIVDAMARSNLWPQACAHVQWTRRVMQPHGRPFPWMMTYDGVPTVAPEQDRAPMSDANRALLAVRVLELTGGDERRTMLRTCVWPILQRVAEHLLDEWLVEESDGLHLRGVENDVVGEPPLEDEPGTLAMFTTVLLKAAQYAAELGHSDAADRFEAAARRLVLPMRDGRYLPRRGGSGRCSVWFECAYYIAEARRFLDHQAWLDCTDSHGRRMTCNYAWLNGAAASSHIRADQPDWAEQFLIDTIRHRAHGPGYFEEVTPTGRYALPPLITAHGAFVTACLEQLVLPDFWDGRKLWLGRGLPAALLARGVRFAHIRAQRGLLVSGQWRTDALDAELRNTSDQAVPIELSLRLPAGIGLWMRTTVNDRPVQPRGQGASLWLDLDIPPRQTARVRVEPAPATPIEPVEDLRPAPAGSPHANRLMNTRDHCSSPSPEASGRRTG